MNQKSGRTVGEAGHEASLEKYASQTSWLRKHHESMDKMEHHLAQQVLKLAKNLNKKYIKVTLEKVDGWPVLTPVLYIKRIEKKLIPTLEDLKFKFNGTPLGRHPKVSAFLRVCNLLNFVMVQYTPLNKLPAGYDIDKLVFKLAHPMLTDAFVANIIQGDVQKNPKWDVNNTIIRKPFPKKEDVIKKITYPLKPTVGKGKKRKQVSAPCRVEGCTSVNRGGRAKGFCHVHYNEHGKKYEETEPWGRI